MNDYNNLLAELKYIKIEIENLQIDSKAIGDWLPKKSVMKFFDYGDSQLRELERTTNIVYSKIKRRKFYSIKSIINLINNNISR